MRRHDATRSENIPNLGQRRQLNSVPQGALFQVGNGGSTQLISARTKAPRQWMVTLMQAVTGKSSVSPWQASVDGGTVFPFANYFTAPQMPDPDRYAMVDLRWGAGGVAFNARFDYPTRGGVFALCADTVDINVSMRDPLASTTYTSLDLIPVVGAFMVEGQPADPSPLAWLEPAAVVNLAATRTWVVKPFARTVNIVIASVSTTASVQFLSASAALLQQRTVKPPAAGVDVVLQDIPVPAQAAVMQVTNVAGANATVYIEWGIGLS